MRKILVCCFLVLIAGFAVFSGFASSKVAIKEVKTANGTKSWHKLEPRTTLAIHGNIFLENLSQTAGFEFAVRHGFEKKLNRRCLMFTLHNPRRSMILLKLSYDPREFTPMAYSKYIFFQIGEARKEKVTVVISSMVGRAPPDEISFLMIYAH